MKILAPFWLHARFPTLLALAAAASLAACDSSPPPPASRQAQQQQPTPFPQTAMRPDVRPPNGNAMGGGGGTQRQRQAEFLNRIRQADPQFKTIDRAVLNEQNELGLILDHTVQMDDIPALMRSILPQMAKEFPGQDLNVIAYAPSNPPMKIGTAHFDARTRDMTYTKEHP